uniref:EF-hand domain-containing protein n=1 Tax=Pyrodinium bahamense TaxID=73915 RepID=A0A7S0B8X7_9DINO|mmetsp:Transcript_561/g.1544  ORF Transcript_561/g.1544 Transcript_561/m.1544 type:complete len:648 (+) Transcript_561:79-2022(+)
MPQPVSHNVADQSACWSTDLGPCHHSGPAIFWPCSPERPSLPVHSGALVDARAGPQRSPGVTFGALGSDDMLASMPRAPIAVNDEETKRTITNMAKKIDILSLQVDNCISGISALQATLAEPPSPSSPRRHPSLLSDTSRRSSRSKSKSCPACSHRSHRSYAETVDADYEGEEGEEGDGGQAKAISEVEEDAQAGPHGQEYDQSDAERSEAPRLSRRWSSTPSQLRALVRRRRGKCTEAVWKFLEEPDSSKAASWYAHLWTPFIMATVVITLLQSLRPAPLKGLEGVIVELVVDAIFVAEAVVRFCVCPSFWAYMQSPYNVIDVLAALPFVGRVFLCVSQQPNQDETGPRAEFELVLLCLAPVLRLLKTLRRFQQFHLFIAVISFTMEALKFLLLTLVLIVLVFSSLIYLVEPRDNIPTLPMAMWLTVVTMTTVGYGDVTPVTSPGISIAAVLVVGSVLFMAMPIGIIGNAFTEMWKDRDRILLNHRFQDRIVQCGYTARDITVLFSQFDINGDGELDMSEFVTMVGEMQLGIQEARAVQLFESIDKDGSGAIDSREFVRSFFPSKFHEIYGMEDKKKQQEVAKSRSSEEAPRSSRSSRSRASSQRRHKTRQQEEQRDTSGDTSARYGEAGTGGVPVDIVTSTCSGT